MLSSVYPHKAVLYHFQRLHHIGKLCVDILSHLESHIAHIGLCSTVHGSLQAVGVYHREDAHGGDEHRQEYDQQAIKRTAEPITGIVPDRHALTPHNREPSFGRTA